MTSEGISYCVGSPQVRIIPVQGLHLPYSRVTFVWAIPLAVFNSCGDGCYSPSGRVKLLQGLLPPLERWIFVWRDIGR